MPAPINGLRGQGLPRRLEACFGIIVTMSSGESLEADQQRRWVAQWKAAASALRSQREQELRTMTVEEAWAATDALLQLAESSPLDSKRETHSGLVELQSYLQRLRTQ